MYVALGPVNKDLPHWIAAGVGVYVCSLEPVTKDLPHSVAAGVGVYVGFSRASEQGPTPLDSCWGRGICMLLSSQ